MQNRYVGDIGDYVRFALLRALAPGFRTGIAWWLFPDERHNNDGRHTGYLLRPEQWRDLDPDVFDTLGSLVAAGRRDIRDPAYRALIGDARHADALFPIPRPAADRPAARRDWLAAEREKLADAELVFVDPDNGLAPAGFSAAGMRGGKYVTVPELVQLAGAGRPLILYQHHTRRKGGHLAELEHWRGRLRSGGFARVDALRARPCAPRSYFLLDAPPVLRLRAQALCHHWRGLLSWHPDPALTPAPPPPPQSPGTTRGDQAC